ncbi:glycoside hydrolase family 130 protein [Dysgonomonas sp.]
MKTTTQIHTGLFTRYSENPILSPSNIQPSREDLIVECLLNPGVFTYRGKTGLLLRVAERPLQGPHAVSFPIMDKSEGIRIVSISKNDPQLNMTDPRVINYKGEDYLTTMSYLLPVFSADGIHFEYRSEYKPLYGNNEYESYGIEDCRVSQIGDEYLLTYTAVSPNGVGVGLKITKDWKNYEDYGLIFPPHNKDCAIFEEKVNGYYYAFHRPSSLEIGGNYLWISRSPDLKYWGKHTCIARTRAGKFDSNRLGVGCAPIRTGKGWLAIYHGATEENRYCLGAMLLDLNDPAKVLARSQEPIMEPEMPYELTGFFSDVIFTNGHIVEGDNIRMYYGAADKVICAAKASVIQILASLNV